MERNSDQEAITLLRRAVELDGERRKTDALAMYKEGIGALMKVIDRLKKDKCSDGIPLFTVLAVFIDNILCFWLELL